MSGRAVDDKAFLASLNAHLDKVADEVVDEVVAAAVEVRNEAVKRTPVDRGLLRAGWQLDSGRTSNGGWAEVSNDVKYVRAVEYGTKPHTIRTKNKKVLASKGEVFGTEVKHPGTKERPMLRPAVALAVPRLMKRLKGI